MSDRKEILNGLMELHTTLILRKFNAFFVLKLKYQTIDTDHVIKLVTEHTNPIIRPHCSTMLYLGSDVHGVVGPLAFSNFYKKELVILIQF